MRSPFQTPTLSWTRLSGPDAVSFDDTTAEDPNVIITQTGVYVLRLTADDGVFQTTDDITVYVDSNADLDSDGLPDAWEITNLGTISVTNGTEINGDGIPYFFEYIYGPKMVPQGYSGFTFEALPDAAAVSGVKYRWTVETGFTMGVDYILEASTDLDTWNPLVLDGEDIMTSTPDGPNNKTVLELEVDDDLGDHIFLRLRNP